MQKFLHLYLFVSNKNANHGLIQCNFIFFIMRFAQKAIEFAQLTQKSANNLHNAHKFNQIFGIAHDQLNSVNFHTNTNQDKNGGFLGINAVNIQNIDQNYPDNGQRDIVPYCMKNHEIMEYAFPHAVQQQNKALIAKFRKEQQKNETFAEQEAGRAQEDVFCRNAG